MIFNESKLKATSTVTGRMVLLMKEGMEGTMVYQKIKLVLMPYWEKKKKKEH